VGVALRQLGGGSGRIVRKLLTHPGAVVPVGDDPPKDAQHRALAPTICRAAALDCAHAFDEATDDSEQEIRRPGSCEKALHTQRRLRNARRLRGGFGRHGGLSLTSTRASHTHSAVSAVLGLPSTATPMLLRARPRRARASFTARSGASGDHVEGRGSVLVIAFGESHTRSRIRVLTTPRWCTACHRRSGCSTRLQHHAAVFTLTRAAHEARTRSSQSTG
jgi:hypothetical protein